MDIDIDMPPLPLIAPDGPTLDGQPQPDAVESAQFAKLEARIAVMENAMNMNRDLYDRMLAILERMSIKENNAVGKVLGSRTTPEEPGSSEQVSLAGPAVCTRPVHDGEREQDRDASPNAVRRRPNDRQSLKEHLKSGSFRPEELFLLLDVDEDDGSDHESPSDVDIMLQDPTPDNRESRRDAFCSYFTAQRFRRAWKEYLALMADIRPSVAGLVVGESDAYTKWLLNMASGSYWPDLMGVHYDIHEKQDVLQRTPGMWIVSNEILQGLGKGELRLRRRLPPASRAAPSSTSS